jgi:hypothetical protein
LDQLYYYDRITLVKLEYIEKLLEFSRG